jgi:hypothetical protein
MLRSFLGSEEVRQGEGQGDELIGDPDRGIGRDHDAESDEEIGNHPEQSPSGEIVSDRLFWANL